MSQGKQSLEWAKAQVITNGTIDSLDKALTEIADASASVEFRESLQGQDLFEGLLVIFAKKYSTTLWKTNPPPKSLLRCIGNLVADNDANRAALSSDLGCMKGLKSSIFNYTSDQQDTELEDFTVKILFNLCNEFPQAQKQAFRMGIHIAVVKYITLRPWKAADESLLSISTDLLAHVVEHKNEIQAKEDYDLMKWMVCSLYLVLVQDLDSAMFLDVLGAMCTYLQSDENFILAVLQEKQMNFVFDSLLLAEKMRRRREQSQTDTALEDSEDEDEDEEKTYRQYIKIIVQALADASSTTTFTTLYTPTDPLVTSLCAVVIPLIDLPKNPTSIPSTACLILGNLATSDSNCIALAAPSKIPIPKLFRHLGSSTDISFLNAAAGLLRHLAMPAQNRSTVFKSPEYLTCASHLYTTMTLEQVQVAGLQLTRQLLTNQPILVSALLSGDEAEDKDNPSASLPTILSLFTTTTSTATKLEIARLVTTCLRAVQPSSTTADPFSTPSIPSFSSSSVHSSYNQILLTLLSHPLLPPLLFAITKEPEPGTLAVQAEAWLGLNLLVRVPGGEGARGIIEALIPASSAIDEDEGANGLFQALERRIRGQQQLQTPSVPSQPATEEEEEEEQNRITELGDDDDEDELEKSTQALTTTIISHDNKPEPGPEQEQEQEQDTRPHWLKKKETENALLLIHDLLMSGEVRDAALQTRLEGLLKEGTEEL